MERHTALVFESLAEALRAKELIDAAGKPKYWLTFIDRVEHHDDGTTSLQSAGQRGRPNPLKGVTTRFGRQYLHRPGRARRGGPE
jgi:hypothetical protein